MSAGPKQAPVAPTFRQDIQGLRAIAVMGVVACHAWTDLLPGGLAGVDVFFVISGYLIGGHLLQSLRDDRFDLRAFYLRRARRLLPALATMLLCVWAMAWWLLSPEELRDLRKHIVASAFFANNLWIWWSSVPSGAGLLEKPLLHLWSLGAEEQFYLVLPALLLLGVRTEGRPMAWVLRCGVLSLVAMCALVAFMPQHQLAAFYLLPTRFWEMAVGVAIAWWHMARKDGVGAQTRRRSTRIERWALASLLLLLSTLLAPSPLGSEPVVRVFAAMGIVVMCLAAFAVMSGVSSDFLHAKFARHADAVSIGGVVLIIAPMCMLTWAGWPGPQVVVPILGAALLAAAPSSALANRALAWPPLVWIGGISYSLYLWHWPLLVLCREAYPGASALAQWIPVLASLVIASLTKVLIEDPVRFGAGAGRRLPLSV